MTTQTLHIGDKPANGELYFCGLTGREVDRTTAVFNTGSFYIYVMCNPKDTDPFSFTYKGIKYRVRGADEKNNTVTLEWEDKTNVV